MTALPRMMMKGLVTTALSTIFLLFLWRDQNSTNSIVGFSSRPDDKDSTNTDEPIVLLGVGLPYTGSLNLHRFLQCQNHQEHSNQEQDVLIDSYHYCCDNQTSDQDVVPTHFPCPRTTCGQCIHQNMLQRKSEPWRGCGISKRSSHQNSTLRIPSIQAYTTLDVETDNPYSWFLPQHFALPLLLPSHKSQSPRPIWILTQRVSATVWAQSIMHWYSRTQRFFRAFDLPYHNPHLKTQQSKEQGSPHGDPLLTIGLSHSVSQHELYQELANGIARANNATLHHERQRLLENVYHQHIQRVTDFCRLHQIPLISLVVDNPQAGKHLTNELTRLTRGSNSLLFGDTDEAWSFQETCWTFDADELDEDWKNFTLPF